MLSRELILCAPRTLLDVFNAKVDIFRRFIFGNTSIGAIITGWKCFQVILAKAPISRMKNKIFAPRTIISEQL